MATQAGGTRKAVHEGQRAGEQGRDEGGGVDGNDPRSLGRSFPDCWLVGPSCACVCVGEREGGREYVGGAPRCSPGRLGVVRHLGVVMTTKASCWRSCLSSGAGEMRGWAVGTRGYIPLENLVGKVPAAPDQDVWSVGCLALTSLSKLLPGAGGNLLCAWVSE